MTSSFDRRLVKLEKYAPVVANQDSVSPLPMIETFFADHSGRLDGESWAMATARLLDITLGELTAYLRARAAGEN